MDRKSPLVLDSGHGVTFSDTHGRDYIDFTSCTGAAPLGISHPAIVDAMTRHLREGGGILPGTMSRHRTALARRLLDTFAGFQRVAFLRTGSCATTAALRLARICTGRNLILTSGYHGWHDWQVQYQQDDVQRAVDHRVVDFGYDTEELARLCELHREDLAAVIVSPEHDVMDAAHLEEIVAVTHRFGAVMILDEVMTGFRVGPGGLTARLPAKPDITVVSKGLANGTALSAVLLGPRVADAHERANLGNTYLRETTPFVAALAGFDLLLDSLPSIHRTTQALGQGLNDAFVRASFPALAVWDDGVLHLIFADHELGARFYGSMIDRGAFLGNGGTILPGAQITEAQLSHALQSAAVIVDGLSRPRTVHDVPAPAREGWQPFTRFCEQALHTSSTTAQRWWATKAHPRLTARDQ